MIQILLLQIDEGHILSIVTGGYYTSDINLGKKEMDKSLKAIKEIINKNIKKNMKKNLKKKNIKMNLIVK